LVILPQALQKKVTEPNIRLKLELWFWVQGFWVLGSRVLGSRFRVLGFSIDAGRGAASQIEKETLKKRISNIE
jgi:hypothetical protein